MAIFRDPRFAAKNYQMRGTHLDHTPRHKFMFWVRFVRTTTAEGSDPNSRWPNGVSFKVHSVDRPRWTVKNNVLNSYGKKRISQTGVEYQPITIKFYDTYDDSVLSFLQEYSRFYFGDFNNDESTAWRHDQTDPTMEMGAGAWGFYNGMDGAPDESYFFDRIEIYTFGNGKYTRWDLVHPKIIEVAPDTHDYSDGNSASEITVSIAYEGIIWPEMATEFTDADGSAEMMGLDEGEYGEFPQTNSLAFVTENFGTTPVVLPTVSPTELAARLDSLFRPPAATPTPRSSSGSGFSNIGSSLGLDFGSILSGALSGGLGGLSGGLSGVLSGALQGGLGSALSGVTGRLTGVINQASSMASGLLGRASSMVGSLGNIGSFFGGLFDSDDLTAPEQSRLAQVITQAEYTQYAGIVSAAMASVAEFNANVNVNMAPNSVKTAIADLQMLSNNLGLIEVGKTSITQILEKLERLTKASAKLNSYLNNSATGSPTSNASYEVTMAHMQKLGIYDKSLASIVAGEIMLDNKSAGYDTTDRSTYVLDSSIFGKINSNLGSEVQLGLMNQQVLQKPSLNPTQRSLRHQLDKSPTYLKQMQLYLENDIATDGDDGQV